MRFKQHFTYKYGSTTHTKEGAILKHKKNTKKENPNPKPIFFKGAAPPPFRLIILFLPLSLPLPLPLPQLTASHLTKPATSPLHLTRVALFFPPLQPTLPISSPLPAGLLFFFTYRSQPPLHTSDKLPSVSRRRAHRAIPIISSDHNKPATHHVFSQPSRAPPSSSQLTDLPSSTGHRPRSPSSVQSRQSFPHRRRPASSSNPRCLLHLLPASLAAASPSHHSNAASSLTTLGPPRQICH